MPNGYEDQDIFLALLKQRSRFFLAQSHARGNSDSTRKCYHQLREDNKALRKKMKGTFLKMDMYLWAMNGTVRWNNLLERRRQGQ